MKNDDHEYATTPSVEPSGYALNLFDPDFLMSPDSSHDRLRDEAPVYWFGPARLWYVTAYDDVASTLRDAQRFSSMRTQAIVSSQVPAIELDRYDALIRFVSRWMVMRDPPAHARARALAARAFTPRVLDQLQQPIQTLVDELLDEVEGGGHMDMVSDFAAKLPLAVISRMLGIPDEDREPLRAWLEDLVTFLGISPNSDAPRRGLAADAALRDYFLRLVAERRRVPRSDLASEIVAGAAEAGEPVSDEDIAGQCVLLFVAGNETTETALSLGLHLLLRHEEELDQLKKTPSLMKLAIEEILRFAPSTRSQGRIVAEDLTLRGQQLHKGELLLLSIDAANRDPSKFVEPHRFDIDREPNPHLTFGAGAHFCLGASLARLELHAGLTTLLQRMPRIHIEAEDWKPPSLMFRQLRSLRVGF